MIVVMKRDATEKQIEHVVARGKEEKLEVYINQNQDQVIIGLVGNKETLMGIPFMSYDGVLNVMNVTSSYKLTSREFHPQDTIVDVDGVKIGGKEGFVTMAGPCSIESKEQMMACARIAKKGGAKILRGGAYKPRTSPYAFQGLEEEGLIYMREAADAYGLKMITEVMDEGHLETVARYTDIIQIGARNMQNFKLLEAVGKTGLPIALKRGISGTIDEWLNAAEYIAVQGNNRIIFVERGIRTYETATRNTLDLSAVPVVQKLSHFPIIVDPSHGVGLWDLVTPMAVAGVASGASGMIVEIHPEPNKAWSDGQQSLNEKHYLSMMKQVNIIEKAMIDVNKIKEQMGE